MTDDPIYALLNQYLDPGQQKTAILDFHQNHVELMKTLPASVSDHHCYPGGYIDHILEVMNNVMTNFPLVVADVGKFDLQDILIASYFHDVDKLFYRYEIDPEPPSQAQLNYAKSLNVPIHEGYESKTSISFKIDAAKQNRTYDLYQVPYFRYKAGTLPFDDGAIVTIVCARNGILLNDQVISAICCHHGSWAPLVKAANTKFQIPPLGILLHVADLISARCQNGKSLR